MPWLIQNDNTHNMTCRVFALTKASVSSEYSIHLDRSIQARLPVQQLFDDTYWRLCALFSILPLRYHYYQYLVYVSMAMAYIIYVISERNFVFRSM